MRLTSALLLSTAVACSHESVSPTPGRLRLELVDDFNFRTGAPMVEIEPPEFGGISGLAFASDENELWALSDARLDCRFYTLGLIIDGGDVTLTPRRVHFLRNEDGTSLEPHVMDPEGIARSSNGAIYISTEGDTGEVPGIDPGLFLFGPDGTMIRAVPVPLKFLPVREGEAPRGVRENLAFEGLALSPDGKRLFVATEQALLQDDEVTTPANGSRSRIIEYAIEENGIRPARELVYELDPVAKPDDFGPGLGENGLVELVVTDSQKLLALERSFFVESGGTDDPKSHQSIRIYAVDLAGASDVSGVESLRQMPEARPVEKALVLDLKDVVSELDPEFPSLDNFEGMCLGPRLSSGTRTLILASDNNFRRRQRTAFLVFEMLEEIPRQDQFP